MATAKKAAAKKKPTSRKVKVVDRPSLPLSKAQKFAAWVKGMGDAAAFAFLIDYIAEGGHLPGFANDHEFSLPAVSLWIDSDPDKKASYARTREERSHIYAEMIIDVSRRDCSTPVLDGEGNVVGKKVDPGAVQQAKLEADNLKWIASRLLPRTYGEKLDVTAKIDTNELTDEALARKLAGFGISVKAVQQQGGANGGA